MALGKTNYKWIITLAMILAVFAIQSYAFTYGDLEAYLIKDISDVPLEIRDAYPDIFYTKHCLTECHMPLLIKWNGVDFPLQKTDLGYYKQEIIGKDLLNSVEMKYLKNISYFDKSWVSNVECDGFFEVNGTWNDNCVDNGYYENIEKWQLVFKDVPSNVPIKSGEWYIIDLIGYKKASLEYHSVDVVPIFKGMNLVDFATWYGSYDYVRRIDVNSVASGALTNFTMALQIDTAPLISGGKLQADCDDLDFVASDNATALDWHYENFTNSDYGCNGAINTTIKIRIPTVANDNTTKTFVYYGDAGISGSQASSYTPDVYDINVQTALTFTSNETNYGILDDFSQNAEDFTNNQSVRIAGIFGQARDKPVGDDYDITSNNVDIHSDTDMSLEVWVNIDEPDLDAADNVWRGEGIVEFSWVSPAWWFSAEGGATTGEGGSVSYPLNSSTWQHILCVYDQDRVVSGAAGASKCYWNGTEQQSWAVDNDGYALSGGSQPTGIMHDMDGTGKGVDGSVDELTYYYDIRTADEILMGYWSRMNNHEFTVLSAEVSGSGGLPPLWSSNTSSTPTNYSPNTYSTINITWVNGSTETVVNTTNVNFSSNYSGSNVVYNMTLVSGDEWSGVYGYEIILGAGTYYWNSSAENNETPSLGNTTDTWEFIISQAASLATLTLSPASPIEYGTENTATCVCNQTEGSCALYRNDTDVTSPENGTAITLGAGGYSYICNITATGNYSTASNQSDYTITQAPQLIDVWINDNLNQNVTISMGESLNVTGIRTVATPGLGAIKIFRNGTQVNDSETTTAYYVNASEDVGFLEFRVNDSTIGHQNYSGNSTGVIYYVTISSELTIYNYNEESNTSVTFNITIENSTNTFTSYNQNPFSSNGTNVAYGDATIIYQATDHPQRKRYTLINAGEVRDIHTYSLATGDGQAVSFYIVDTSESPIDNVLVTARRLLDSEWLVVDQEKTDSSGFAELFLKADSLYMLKFNRSGYTDVNSNVTPSQASYKVYMGTSVAYEGNYSPTLWENISLNINPIGGALTNTTNQSFVFTLLSTDSQLEWWGMNITHGNGTVLFSNNTTDAGGGTMTYTIDLSNEVGQNMSLTVWFKKTGYDVWFDPHLFFVHGRVVRGVIWIFNELGDINPFALGLIALVVSMSVAGVVSTKLPFGSKLGGGVIMLGVLAIFIWYFDTGLWGWGLWFITSLATASMLYLRGGWRG